MSDWDTGTSASHPIAGIRVIGWRGAADDPKRTCASLLFVAIFRVRGTRQAIRSRCHRKRISWHPFVGSDGISPIALRTVEVIAGRTANPHATVRITALLPECDSASLTHNLEKTRVLDVGAIAG